MSFVIRTNVLVIGAFDVTFKDGRLPADSAQIGFLVHIQNKWRKPWLGAPWVKKGSF